MTALPKVAVILVNWNGWQDTIECLNSILRSDYPDYQIIVCDNDSKDDSLTHIKEWARTKNVGDKLVLIETGGNLGFAGGNNVGLRYTLNDEEIKYMWLLNNDTVIHHEAMRHLVERMQAKPKVGICGSTVAYYDRRDVIEAMGGAWYDRWVSVGKHIGIGQRITAKKNIAEVEKKMSYVFGASMMVSRQFLIDVGLMNEDYFIYGEEIDWARRARPKYSLAYAPESIVYHKGSGSIGLKEKSDTSKYYEIRNRLIVTKKHFPYALGTVKTGIIVEMIGFFLSGQWTQGKMLWNLLCGRRDPKWER